MEFKTNYTKNHVKNYEANTQPSKTVPNQAMSIPELISRYAQGLPLGGSRVPSYSEDPENDLLGGVDFRTLDLSEQHKVMMNIKDELNDIKKRKNQRKESSTSNGEGKKPSQEPSDLSDG